jgi:hypothetical protein
MPYRVALVTVLFIVFALLSPPVDASVSGVVISQVYGGGGNSGSTYKQDFIEIFNGGQSPVNIGGWSVQTRSVAGATWFIATLPDLNLLVGQYFLIQVDGATTNNGTVDLPSPDLVSGLPGMSAAGGRVALVTNNITVEGVNDPDVVDFVGYNNNSGGEPFESETSPAVGMSNTNSLKRRITGCVDTNNNFEDFEASPAYPYARNRQSPLSICNSSGVTATATPFTPVPTSTSTNAPDVTLSPTSTTSTSTSTSEPVTSTATLSTVEPTTDFTSTPESTTEATFTATLNATAEPTPTATFGAGIELLVNGGMEGAPNADKSPLGWRVKRGSKDRQKCNMENKLVAYVGFCTFMFKGGAGEKSQLSQNVVLENFSFQQGDMLRLTFALNAPNSAAKGKIKLRMKYGDNTEPYKFDQDFGKTTQYVLTEVFIPVNSANLLKISLKFIHQSGAGKVYVDAVSVMQFKASGMVSLP